MRDHATLVTTAAFADGSVQNERALNAKIRAKPRSRKASAPALDPAYSLACFCTRSCMTPAASRIHRGRSKRTANSALLRLLVARLGEIGHHCYAGFRRDVSRRQVATHSGKNVTVVVHHPNGKCRPSQINANKTFLGLQPRQQAVTGQYVLEAHYDAQILRVWYLLALVVRLEASSREKIG